MITAGVLLVFLGVGGSQLPVPYVALGPGPTLNTLGDDSGGKEIIQIDGRSERKSTGHLNLTTVGVRDQLDLFTAFRAWVDRRASVVPREEIYPPGKSQQEVDQQTTQQFVESQSTAEYAALGELGYPAQVVIQSVPKGSPSTGKLAEKDVVTSIEGKPVHTSDDVRGVLSAIQPGADVTVGYSRAGKAGIAKIVTTKPAGRKGAAVGVLLTDQRKAPFDVKIQLDESIGGPSAGLMFALGILEKVGPDELTGGKFIAGTGEMSGNGTVGPIGGIQLKMIGAREKGAVVFLVPKDNCADALAQPPAGLQLIKVGTLHDAVQALKALQAGQPVPSC
ncbi:MAG: Lon-like protease [Mycobacteriales bacterium]|jgi:PDZ domain-containing protein